MRSNGYARNAKLTCSLQPRLVRASSGRSARTHALGGAGQGVGKLARIRALLLDVLANPTHYRRPDGTEDFSDVFSVHAGHIADALLDFGVLVAENLRERIALLGGCSLFCRFAVHDIGAAGPCVRGERRRHDGNRGIYRLLSDRGINAELLAHLLDGVRGNLLLD